MIFIALLSLGATIVPLALYPISRLIKNNRQIPVARLMDRQLHSVRIDQDQEEVSQLFRQYGIAKVPVVDESNRLVGVITMDDVLGVVDKEGEQDMLLLGGLSRDDFFDDLLKTLWARLPWLSINLMTAILASLVIFAFEDTLAKIVALAILMPITASMGGNAGTQTPHRLSTRTCHTAIDLEQCSACYWQRNHGWIAERRNFCRRRRNINHPVVSGYHVGLSPRPRNAVLTNNRWSRRCTGAPPFVVD
ncbi:MAG: magnesium transporter [Alphaproteobacteria bacterium]|nr:magnesium transporter [Alphaproteobacteria bacterium]